MSAADGTPAVCLAVAFAVLIVAPPLDGPRPGPGPGTSTDIHTFDPAAMEGVGQRDSLRLEPRPDGSYLYKDADSGLSARINADGSVEFLRTMPRPSLEILGFDVLDRGKPRDEPATPAGLPGMPQPRGLGDPTHDPGSYGGAPILVSFGMRLPSIADLVNRRKNHAAKQRFMDDTSRLREGLRIDDQRRNTSRRLGALRAELEHVWRDPARTFEQRRRHLFELWDECEDIAPSGDTVSDRFRQRAGARARTIIEAFVRAHLPRGSGREYRPAELERLNRERTSAQAFAPYGNDGTAASGTAH